jgi:hypothetical protein
MSTTVETLPQLLKPPAPATRSVAARAATIFLPKEHGSWSLAFEPLAIGMLLAPSSAGVALLAAAMAGFFARRPFKAAFAARHSPARRDAREALGMLLSLALAGGFGVLVLGDAVALWPLLLALPCGLLFAYFDGQGEGRAAAAEVAGSAAFAMLPAVFATLAGWSAGAALSLATLALVRSVPTVLTIRTFLRQRKGETVSAFIPLISAGLGLVLVLQLARAGQLPWLATAGAAVLLARTGWLAGPWRPAWTARQAGIIETLLGLGYCLLLALAGLRQIPGV